MEKLHIDIETFSPVNIKTCGAYKYMQSKDFEVLMIAYAFNDEDIEIVDLAQGELLPERFKNALTNTKVQKWAHNATFERLAFNKLGFCIPAKQWFCTSIKAAYCGFPLSLDGVSKAMNLDDKAKSAAGKKLIKYFCMPCKPTKVNGQRTRNLPEHDPEKWQEFKDYCVQDVAAEREVDARTEKYSIPAFERLNYLLDQKINDRGILADLNLAKQATLFDNTKAEELTNKMKALTGLDNPNSPAQLKKWLSEAMQKEIKSLAKEHIPGLIAAAGSVNVAEVLKLRIKASKTSTAKYKAVTASAGYDTRIRGLIQFYGASRTGRWAGRLVQVQNLPRNYLKDLELAREVVASGDYDLMTMLFDDIPNILSQLIRTALVATEGSIFSVADFSAIEARVIAWLCGEKWRLEVFKTHGKIYEASASMMFNVPLESIVKGSKNYELRAKGKVAELALGYQGAVGALKQMGGEAMGLNEREMKIIVSKWRKANPSIVQFWKETEANVKKALRTKKEVVDKFGRLKFNYDGEALTIELPSGRKLFYQNPSLIAGKYGQSVRYKGMNQTTRQWQYIDSYGGKFVENIVQAVARDLLANSMLNLDSHGYDIVMHVHDEAICEIPDTGDAYTNNRELDRMCEIMSIKPDWAEGLPLAADGYLTPFYKKD